MGKLPIDDARQASRREGERSGAMWHSKTRSKRLHSLTNISDLDQKRPQRIADGLDAIIKAKDVICRSESTRLQTES